MKRWLNSAWYACKGVASFFSTEANAKLELAITVITIALSIWLKLATWEFCVVIICIGLLLMAEMLNTAIERLANFITKEHHAAIGEVKDIAAAAVMMISIASFVVAIFIFGPKLWDKISLLL